MRCVRSEYPDCVCGSELVSTWRIRKDLVVCRRSGNGIGSEGAGQSVAGVQKLEFAPQPSCVAGVSLARPVQDRGERTADVASGPCCAGSRRRIRRSETGGRGVREGPRPLRASATEIGGPCDEFLCAATMSPAMKAPRAAVPRPPGSASARRARSARPDATRIRNGSRRLTCTASSAGSSIEMLRSRLQEKTRIARDHRRGLGTVLLQ